MYEVALEVAIRCARDAGRVLLAEHHRPGGPRGYGGSADVDQEAEAILQNGLEPVDTA
jgi:hypothetical protein